MREDAPCKETEEQAEASMPSKKSKKKSKQKKSGAPLSKSEAAAEPALMEEMQGQKSQTEASTVTIHGTIPKHGNSDICSLLEPAALPVVEEEESPSDTNSENGNVEGAQEGDHA